MLRELIVEIVRLRELGMRDRLHGTLRDLLLGQLESASPMPIHLTLPQDPRARAIAETVMGHPAERRTLAAMCGSLGVSVRTIERVFRREVGSDFLAAAGALNESCRTACHRVFRQGSRFCPGIPAADRIRGDVPRNPRYDAGFMD